MAFKRRLRCQLHRAAMEPRPEGRGWESEQEQMIAEEMPQWSPGPRAGDGGDSPYEDWKLWLPQWSPGPRAGDGFLLGPFRRGR